MLFEAIDLAQAWSLMNKMPSPSATSNPGGSVVLQPAWIAAGAAVIGAFVAAAVALRQQRNTRRLEREKLHLEDQLARQRTLWDEERKTETQRSLAEKNFEEHLLEQAKNADALHRLAIEYRRKIVNRLRPLKILDMSKPLDLERIYVQLRVREEESPRFVSEEAIADVNSGRPEQLLQLSREIFRAGSIAAIPPEEALSRYQRMVVLGDPGAGKTTMLRHLAFRAAREELTNDLSLPVYVELRNFIDSSCHDLLSYAVADMLERYGFPAGQSYLEEQIHSGHVILLLDGLDEVLGGVSEDAAEAAYRKVVTEVDRLATRHPNIPIAITCRRAGWRGGLAQFQTLEVLDFDWPEIEIFITNWFGSAPAKGRKLADVLSGNVRMQTLAANPLLLSLICIVYERDLELPERRAELYNRCVEVLLKDWDTHRDIKRFSRFTVDRKRDLLQEVSWHFHCQGRRYFPVDELKRIIESFLPTIDIDPQSAQGILDEIVAQYGLLKVQAHNWYGFLHLTLQEYFAAVAANEQGISAINYVTRRRNDPWWEEVILLLAGRTTDASPLLLSILGRSGEDGEPEASEPLAIDDDIFQSDLLLSARCLISRPRVRDRWLRDRIIAEVQRLLLHSPYQFVVRRAANVLAEIGVESVRASLLTFLGDTAIPEETRAAIAGSFGDAGDAVSASRLLTVFQSQARKDYIPRGIAESLAKLRYTDALPTLLKITEECLSVKTSPSGLPEVIDAITILGDNSLTPTLWKMIERPFQSSKYMLIEAIGQLGSTDDIERLRRLNRHHEAASIASAITTLGGPESFPILVEILLDPDISVHDLLAIITFLCKVRSPAIIADLIRVLNDSSLDWQLRWMIADILEEYPRRECEDGLLHLLADSSLDPRLKIRIASILASWDNPIGLPYLLDAFDENVLPTKVTIQRGSGSVKRPTWRTVASALKRLGDETVVPGLIAKYRQFLSKNSDISSEANEEARNLADALAPFHPVQILPSLIDGIDVVNLDVNFFALDHIVSQIITPAEFPLISSSLSWRRTPYLQNTIRQAVKLADASEETKQLIQAMSRLLIETPSGRPPFRSELDFVAASLEQMSRQAGVRVFRDGRLLSSET